MAIINYLFSGHITSDGIEVVVKSLSELRFGAMGEVQTDGLLDSRKYLSRNHDLLSYVEKWSGFDETMIDNEKFFVIN